MLAKADEEATVCIQQGRQPEKQVSRAQRVASGYSDTRG